MRRFGCLAAFAAVCALTACKDKDAKKTGGADNAKRCEQLGKACGDGEKHVTKIADGCKALKPGCAATAAYAFDCYEKELCGKGDKIWAFEDFGVLAERHGKCVTERNAVNDCVAKP